MPLILADSAAGREVAVENDEVAVGFDRVAERADDLLALWIGFHALEIFGDGLASDGHAIAVEEALLEKHFHERDDAADGDELTHQKAAAGLEISQDRNFASDAGEVGELQFHPGTVGHRDKMEHGIGRSAECDDDRDGIFECLLRHDVERADAALDQIENGRARSARVGGFSRRDGVLRGAVWQTHAERFDGTRHGVRRVHSTA